MLKFNDYLKEAKLSAKQKKIAKLAGDEDKIDSDDLKALRAGAKLECKEEAEQVEEGRMKDLAYDLENMKDHEFHQHYGKAKHEMDPTHFKKPVQKGHEMDRAKALAQRGIASLTKEEVTQVVELSKKTLANYINHAAHDAASGAYHGKEYTAQSLQHTMAGDWDASKEKHDMATKHFNRANKRLVNIPKATDRLKKEEVEQIDEISRKTLASYVKKGVNDISARRDASKSFSDRADDMRKVSHEVGVNIGKGAAQDEINAKRKEYQDKADMHAYKAGKRGQGVTKALDKLAKEETEQIDEISKKTLGSYINKAAHDSRMQGHVATDFENLADKARKQSNKDSYERIHRKYLSKAWKREAGIAKAVGKLTKEGVEEVDEGILDNLKNTLIYKINNYEKDKAVKAGGKTLQLYNQGLNIAKKGLPEEVDKEEVKQIDETMTRKHFQQVADVIKAHPDQEKRNELAKHHADIFKASNPRFDHGRFYAAAGANIKEEVEHIEEAADIEAIKTQYKKNESENRHTENAELLAKHFGTKSDQNKVAKAKAYRDRNRGYSSDAEGRHYSKLAHEVHSKLYHHVFGESVEVNEDNHMMSYVNATLAVMDEGRIDDLRDAQRLRAANKSAYDKDYKSDDSHPHIKLNKGTAYGGSNQKDDEGDEKPDNEKQEKRGRGRPHGSKSGARQKGGGRDSSIDGREYQLHLPNNK